MPLKKLARATEFVLFIGASTVLVQYKSVGKDGIAPCTRSAHTGSECFIIHFVYYKRKISVTLRLKGAATGDASLRRTL